jgi:hypothetical protein
MKTTELYVEQCFIGALVIAIVLIPWIPELWSELESLNAAIGLVTGSIALGVAFWLGIPFDRLADTLTERLDRHNRLRFALTRAVGREVPTQGGFKSDLFPEDQFRLEGLRDSDSVVSWIDYHRSRIRLSRALALYGPALTLTLSYGVARAPQEHPARASQLLLPAIVGAYILWALLARSGERLPRTDHPCVIAYAKRWGHVREAGTRIQESDQGDPSVWVSEWRVLAVPLALLAVALALAFRSGSVGAQLAASGGALLTVIAAWSWWRISITFRSYLCDLGRWRRAG